MTYLPQGRNIFPELSVRHNLELGGVATKTHDVAARTEAAMDRFPVLRRKADRQASTLSGGEQKLLEIARGLLLDPKRRRAIGGWPRLLRRGLTTGERGTGSVARAPSGAAVPTGTDARRATDLRRQQ